MAISTVSSLNEAFTSGVSLTSDETTQPPEKDKTGTPTVDETRGPSNADSGRDADQTSAALSEEPKQEDADMQTEDAKVITIDQPQEPSAANAHQTEGEAQGADEGSETGSDDDAILEVHD